MNSIIWLYIASGLSFFTFLVHLFAGGKTVAAPLLDSDLTDEPKYTNYYCWHIVTIVLGCMTIAFYCSAVGYTSLDLSKYVTLQALLFTLWSVVLTVWKKQKVLTLPQWILFLPITFCGYFGSW